MRVVDLNKTVRKIPVGELEPGSAIINGEGNLCVVCRSDLSGKIRLVNLQSGGTYLVDSTCKHEPVEASVSWKRNG